MNPFFGAPVMFIQFKLEYPFIFADQDRTGDRGRDGEGRGINKHGFLPGDSIIPGAGEKDFRIKEPFRFGIVEGEGGIGMIHPAEYHQYGPVREGCAIASPK
jgi:hypothetical protein